jgi:hypothetical protein
MLEKEARSSDSKTPSLETTSSLPLTAEKGRTAAKTEQSKILTSITAIAAATVRRRKVTFICSLSYFIQPYATCLKFSVTLHHSYSDTTVVTTRKHTITKGLQTSKTCYCTVSGEKHLLKKNVSKPDVHAALSWHDFFLGDKP